MRKQLIMALAASIGALGASGMEAATAAEPPKLILALTIDGQAFLPHARAVLASFTTTPTTSI